MPSTTQRREIDQLLSKAIHDLRSPLNSSTLLVQVLLKRFGPGLHTEAKWIVERIAAQMGQMGELIAGLSAFVEADVTSELPKGNVDLNAIVQAVLTEFETAIAAASGEVHTSDLPSVAGSAEQMKQLFRQLAGNALKYRKADEPLRIEISAENRDEACLISMKDNGIGFSPEFREQIFEPFKRLHVIDVSGAGMGLAICKRIVENHGGSIWAESEVDKGTAVYVRLPIAHTRAAS